MPSRGSGSIGCCPTTVALGGNPNYVVRTTGSTHKVWITIKK